MADAVILADRLTKVYPRHARGITELSFDVRAGEVFGFLGPNGAGKTTTIRCLIDLLRPTSGTARVLGMDPRADAPRIAARIGYLPGELGLAERLTAADQIRYFANLRGGISWEKVESLASRFELDLTRRVREMSRGNKQKVGIVQAFMHEPELLILDEPTGGLDPLMQQEFNKLVREAKKAGRTVFLSSHILPEVEALCDRVAIIREGKLVAVEDVGTITHRAVRTARIRFAKPRPASALDGIAGVSDARASETGELVCTVRGPTGALVKALAAMDVVDLQLKEPTLEEAFLGFYGHEEAMSDVMLRSVLRRTIYDQRRALIGFGIGLVIYCIMISSIWPTVAKQGQDFQKLIDSYPPALRAAFDIGQFDGPGYLKGEMFSFMLPILFLVYAIGRGADLIAGEEERGSLDLLLSHPQPRGRIVVEKAIGLLVGLGILTIVLYVALAIGDLVVDMKVNVLDLAGQVLLLYLIAAMFGLAAMTLGALRARRGGVIGVVAAAAAITYFLTVIARLVTSLDAIKWISPFYYYTANDPLTHGANVFYCLGLLGVTLALLGGAIVGFERRDVGVA